MIPNDFVQSLLTRVDIVEVIDRLVPLRKAGANYVACCPFHKEKSPSFSVSPSKQFYHCFGCGAHGTAIGFLMEYSGKTFPEAVEDLAREAGLSVPRTQADPAKAIAPDHYATMEAAAQFYRSQLRATPSAIAYLKKRGLTGTVAARYGIGYAPDAWQGLEQIFPDYQMPALDALGLVLQNDQGRRYDRFRDRIMFPIHDARGRTIAFGGRIIDQGEPKYLNSPETALFSKGHELYGLYQARDAIRQRGCAIVVEGYMDVVALAQHGVEYCVATLGTATTAIHTQKLYRLTDSVVFCFDGDRAGRQAAWRALVNTLPVLQDGKGAAFLFLPDGLDPDDFIRQQGHAAFEEALERATPLSEFLLAEMTVQHPPHSAEGRAALINALRPLLATVTAPALLALLRRRLAELTELAESELKVLLSDRDGAASAQRRYGDKRSSDKFGQRGGRSLTALTVAEQRTPFRSARRTPSLIRTLLQTLVQQPSLARDHDIPVSDERSPEAQALNDIARFCRDNESTPTPAALLQYFSDSIHHPLVTEALTSADTQEMPLELVASQFEAALQRWQQQLQQKEVATLLKTPLSQLTSEQRASLGQLRKTAPPAAQATEQPANTTPGNKPLGSAKPTPSVRSAQSAETPPAVKPRPAVPVSTPAPSILDDDTPPF